MTVLTIAQPFSHTNNHYYLDAHIKDDQLNLTMRMKTPVLYTGKLPHTKKILQKHLPSVLRSKCFNSLGLPFSQEVCDTEFGHLFEHIMLEYLCMCKLSRGYRSASFKGETYWNWKKDPSGTFYIVINMNRGDSLLFHEALDKTIELSNLLLNTQKH